MTTVSFSAYIFSGIKSLNAPYSILESTSDWLLKASVNELPLAQCQQEFNAIPNSKPIRKSQVCANDQITFSDTCQGKSNTVSSHFFSDFLAFQATPVVQCNTQGTICLTCMRLHRMDWLVGRRSLQSILAWINTWIG